MNTRHSVTFTLPPAMHRAVKRVQVAEQRTTSELMREALRVYLRAPRPYLPTPRELRAIEAGRAALRRGDRLTLEQARAYVDRRRTTPRSPRPRSRP